MLLSQQYFLEARPIETMGALRRQLATSLKAGLGIVTARLMQQPSWQAVAAVLAAMVCARLLIAVAGWARRIAVLSSIPSPGGAHLLTGHMKQVASSK